MKTASRGEALLLHNLAHGGGYGIILGCFILEKWKGGKKARDEVGDEVGEIKCRRSRAGKGIIKCSPVPTEDFHGLLLFLTQV